LLQIDSVAGICQAVSHAARQDHHRGRESAKARGARSLHPPVLHEPEAHRANADAIRQPRSAAPSQNGGSMAVITPSRRLILSSLWMRGMRTSSKLACRLDGVKERTSPWPTAPSVKMACKTPASCSRSLLSKRLKGSMPSAELLADLGAGEAEAKAEQSGPSAIKVSGNKPGIRAGSISKRRGATRPLRTRSQYA
jgi:hypothetical protein